MGATDAEPAAPEGDTVSEKDAVSVDPAPVTEAPVDRVCVGVDDELTRGDRVMSPDTLGERETVAPGVAVSVL